MKYNFGIIIKNFPASGMMWSDGYIEGTGLSAEIGLHRSFDVFDGKSLNLNTMSSIKTNKTQKISFKLAPYLFIAVTIFTALGSNGGTWV